MNRDLNEPGFCVVPDALDEAAIAVLLLELQQTEQQAANAVNDRTYAVRNLFEAAPGIRRLAASRQVRRLVEPFLGPNCFAVRAIYFDKLPDANWKVPWHQDLSVAVAARHDVEGFGPWSRKAGVLHAQAPASLLERMLTVRLHLDACDMTNGPLRVLPGAQLYGKLDFNQIEALRSRITEAVCQVDRGGALLMRPLLVHASSAAQSPHHRRVIHIEYANTPLPEGLNWHEVVTACVSV